MQKIFSQELRFKDENGNDYADWEKKRLEEKQKEREFKEQEKLKQRELNYHRLKTDGFGFRLKATKGLSRIANRSTPCAILKAHSETQNKYEKNTKVFA